MRESRESCVDADREGYGDKRWWHEMWSSTKVLMKRFDVEETKGGKPKKSKRDRRRTMGGGWSGEHIQGQTDGENLKKYEELGWGYFM